MILIDSQPFSEFGKLLSSMKRPDGTDGFSRPDFPKHVAKQLRKHRLQRDAELSTADVWRCTRNGTHLLTYFMNTAIPEDLPCARAHLSNIDALFVMGHHPHGEVLDALPIRPLHFIGGDGTSYADDDEGDSLVHRLHHSATARSAFSQFTYVHFYDKGDKGDTTVCTFAEWADFAMHAFSRWTCSEQGEPQHRQ